MKNLHISSAQKEWRLIRKQGRVDQSEHRYYSIGLNALQGSRTANDSGKYKLREISRNNTSRKEQFEELLEDSQSELIKLNLFIRTSYVTRNT